MDTVLGSGWERRLEHFLSALGELLGNPSRRASFAAYTLGLLGDSERKSIEPLAARTCLSAAHADAAHQRLQHFITASHWQDAPVRTWAAQQAVRSLQSVAPITSWIIDDTGFLKQGQHSVGVQRQSTGSAGKISNCQIGVSLTLATSRQQLPIDFELYLPRSWTDDPARREEARLPADLPFQTKAELAVGMVRRALRQGFPKGVLLADAWYGSIPSFRAAVQEELGLDYAVGVDADTSVLVRERTGAWEAKPVSVEHCAQTINPSEFRRISWREGTQRRLSSRFAFRRVKSAHVATDDPRTRKELWLIIEWRQGEATPHRFALSTLPASLSKKKLVQVLMERWRTERVYEELKGELGLDHFEGRRFAGWHHHVTVALCGYAFIVMEQARLFSPEGSEAAARANPRATAASLPNVPRQRAARTGARRPPLASPLSHLSPSVHATAPRSASGNKPALTQ